MQLLEGAELGPGLGYPQPAQQPGQVLQLQQSYVYTQHTHTVFQHIAGMCRAQPWLQMLNNCLVVHTRGPQNKKELSFENFS